MRNILVNGWFWQRPETGSGQYLNALLPRMAGQAPDCQFHLLIPRNGDHEDDRCPPNVIVRAVTLPPGPANLAKVWWEQWLVPRWGRRLQADRVWNPYWTAALWQPDPVLVTVHDVIPLIRPEYRIHFRQRLYLRLTRAATRRAQHVLTVSQAAQRDLAAGLDLDPTRIAVVYNGVGPPPDAPADRTRPETLREFNLTQPYFLYLGGYERRKNVETALRAFRRFRDLGGDPAIQMVLAGQLPDADTAVLQHPGPLVTALNLQDAVRLLGRVSEAQKAALYRHALAFVFPGLYEGFGLMLVEAMQAGVPVITSRR